MKKILALAAWLLVCSVYGWSQTELTGKYTTTAVKVYGNCTQCKARIEKAAKGKGVKSAIWDIDSKILTLVYDPVVTNSEKVQQRIANVGHDTELKKAKDFVYQGLPDCCLYRDHENTHHDDINEEAEARLKSVVKTAGMVMGVVMETDDRGNFHPLKGASIMWLHNGQGIQTDSNGVFKMQRDSLGNKIVISFAGYKTDTLEVGAAGELKVVLASGQQLKEVKVSARQRSSYYSLLNPIRTQVLTDKELFKAACCNLSESFETNPSVDVSYNDAVTGSKQIQLLGLSGNYTQLTVENLPGPRGIATPLGLNSIAGPWVESIQLTKGIGSVANGFESIAGQINVELKKPENSERVFANAYINDQGKTDVNLNLSQKIGKKWAVGLLLHDDFNNDEKLDFNKDGFRDLPTGNLFSVINRWKFDNGKGWMIQFGVKGLYDKRTGGETDYNASKDQFTTNNYGLGITTKRTEEFAKIGYVFPQKKYKSIGLQLSSFQHDQDSYFGLNSYNANQDNFYSNLIYQSIIGSTAHKFRTGISFVYDRYNEQFNNANYKRNETVPGAFFEYTYSLTDKFNAVAGVRVDHNNLYGTFVTPRLHLRYEPVKGTTIRLSAGKGQRTANVFAENLSLLASSRQLNILSASADKAYGLDPEVAWNEGFSIDQAFKLFARNGMISIDLFRTDFQNQVVIDLDKSAREANFYNLQGRSYSNSLQLQAEHELLPKFSVRLAYRLFDVKTTYHDELLERPLVAKHRAFANLAYEFKGWKFDYTVTFNGSKRLPFTGDNPSQYQLPDRSPSYWMMNAQLSKTFGKKYPLDIYIGGENLTNYYQRNAVLAADQPFGPYFDASMVWGPLSGRMFYTGLRYKIK
jgi:outer membrane receptor for ferrienterochelin and colicins